jgi:hypothetical protein
MEWLLVALIAVAVGRAYEYLSRSGRNGRGLEERGPQWPWMRDRPWAAGAVCGSLVALISGGLVVVFNLLIDDSNGNGRAITVAVFLGVLVFLVISIHGALTHREEREKE